MEIMSSEESGQEDVIIVHPLPWLSESVAKVKSSLDQQIVASNTPQSRRQTKKRLVGCSSNRSVVDNLPAWAVKK